MPPPPPQYHDLNAQLAVLSERVEHLSGSFEKFAERFDSWTEKVATMQRDMAVSKAADVPKNTPATGITANLSVREIILLLAALFGLITGKFDWITSIFK